MIKLANVSKSFADFKINDVSLEIKKGEYFVILGPSGAGKTLLLEMIAGLITPDSGEIRGISRKKIGLIYQDYMLFPHLDVFHNIAFGLRIRKEKKEKINSEVAFVSRQLGVNRLLKRKTATLSGGEKQRVAIARAMVMKPDIYLFDEPTAALDLSTKIQTQRLILQLHKKNSATIIHVTHDFEEALAMGDRIGLLFSGRIIQNDSPEKVFNNPATKEVADFLGYKNVFSGRIKQNKMPLKGIEITTPVKKADLAYITIRANDIILSSERIVSSARNSFFGEVVKIIKRTNHVEVLVDIGIIMFADITYRSFQEMELKPGKKIWTTFKTSAVKVFSH